MTYLSKDLSVLAYANGYTWWHYTTQDTAEQVLSHGYFNGAVDMLRVGDTMIVNVNTASNIDAIDILVKKVSNNEVVVVERNK